jgi:hypothetical protein
VVLETDRSRVPRSTRNERNVFFRVDVMTGFLVPPCGAS